MKVRTKLVAVGALLPAALLAIAVVLAGWLFRRAQLADLDRQLLAQAAVESVGMFDSPEGSPHVHAPRSPIAAVIKDFAPLSAIYDDHGEPATEVIERALLPARVAPEGTPGVVRLDDREVAGVPRRVLALPVLAPDRRIYTLWLGASLVPLDATMARFWRTTLAVVGGVALVLLAIQLAVAHRLARRIAALTSFVPRLHDGAATLAADPTRDEVGELGTAMRDVARRLVDARAEQDRLLASAAHELRTPLTVLRTEVDLALRKERSADELRDALRAVRADLERLGALASALLDLQAVRHLGFDRRDGDLAALVREACEGFRVVAEAHGIVLRAVGVSTSPARYDERALRQAIDNLIGNAIKYAPPGSSVEVEVARVAERWQIAVTDRGPGIPVDQAERIFEPFQRATTTAAPGAGLGLAIVREVATRHGGRAWLDPAPTIGARFVVELGT